MGAMMARAVKEAIRQGGVKDLSFENKILVARAILILEHMPDNPDEKIPLHVPTRAYCGAGG